MRSVLAVLALVFAAAAACAPLTGPNTTACEWRPVTSGADTTSYAHADCLK